jgi:hypothetical protein
MRYLNRARTRHGRLDSCQLLPRSSKSLVAALQKLPPLKPTSKTRHTYRHTQVRYSTVRHGPGNSHWVYAGLDFGFRVVYEGSYLVMASHIIERCSVHSELILQYRVVETFSNSPISRTMPKNTPVSLQSVGLQRGIPGY